MIGTRPNEEDLGAAERKAWLFVGRLKEDTTAEKVKGYLVKNGIGGDIECEDLNAQGHKKAFKTGIPFNFLGTIEDPGFWPAGVLVRQFHSFWSYIKQGQEKLKRT